MFHLLFHIIDCIIYSIRKKGKVASPAQGVAPPRSSRVKDARSLSQKRPKKIHGNLSLFSHQPQSKRMPFGILLFIPVGMFLLIHPMRHTTADQQKEQQDKTRAVFLKINEIMSQDHLDHDRGNLSDERRLEMLLR